MGKGGKRKDECPNYGYSQSKYVISYLQNGIPSASMFHTGEFKKKMQRKMQRNVGVLSLHF